MVDVSLKEEMVGADSMLDLVKHHVHGRTSFPILSDLLMNALVFVVVAIVGAASRLSRDEGDHLVLVQIDLADVGVQLLVVVVELAVLTPSDGGLLLLLLGLFLLGLIGIFHISTSLPILSSVYPIFPEMSRGIAQKASPLHRLDKNPPWRYIWNATFPYRSPAPFLGRPLPPPRPVPLTATVPTPVP